MVFGKEKEIDTRKSSRLQKIERCFDCGNDVIVKYNRGKKDWVLKNNWEYWTEKEENKNRYKCNNCLYSLYNDRPFEFSKTISENKKKNFFVYVWDKRIKGDGEIEKQK